MDWTANYKALMSQISRKPLHQHDCDRCEYKGSINGFDIYVCSNVEGNLDPLLDSLIARYGKGGEYSSMPRKVFADVVSEHIMGNVGDGKGALIENPKLPHWVMAILLVAFSGKEE